MDYTVKQRAERDQAEHDRAQWTFLAEQISGLEAVLSIYRARFGAERLSAPVADAWEAARVAARELRDELEVVRARLED